MRCWRGDATCVIATAPSAEVSTSGFALSDGTSAERPVINVMPPSMRPSV
jgi:hypothetical protein